MMRRMIHASVLVLLGLAVLGESTPRILGQAPSPATAKAEITPRAASTHVASTGPGGFVTIKDIQDFVLINQIPGLAGVQPRQVPTLANDALNSASQWISSRRIAEHDYDQMPETTPSKVYCTQVWNAARAQSLMQLLAKVEILDKMTSPTETQLHAYFDQHRPEFKQPFQFTMRHLILLTYKSYIVQEGDTLESIAQKISGDVKKAAEIRADLPAKPLRREEKVDFKPLVRGEKLLVPMSESDASIVRSNLENIIKEIKTPADFKAAAEKYSETEGKGEVSEPLPSGTRPPLPELLDAAQKTPVNAISPIFRTKHGYQVIQVVSKIAEGYKPFEAARPQIVAAMQETEKKKHTDALLQKLIEIPDFQVDVSKISDSNAITTETEIGHVGSHRILWNDFKTGWETSNHPKEPALIKKLVVERAKNVLEALGAEYMKPQLADPKTDIARVMKNMRSQIIGSALLTRQAQQKANESITPGMEEDYYKKHPEDFRLPSQVSFSAIEKHLTNEQRSASDAARTESLNQYVADMAKMLSTIDSPERFKDLAAQSNTPLKNAGVTLMESPVATRSVDGLPKVVQTEISKLKPGQWSKPFVVDNEKVAAVLLLTRSEEKFHPFESMKDYIHDTMMKQRIQAAYDQLVATTLSDAHYVFLLNRPKS